MSNPIDIEYDPDIALYPHRHFFAVLLCDDGSREYRSFIHLSERTCQEMHCQSSVWCDCDDCVKMEHDWYSDWADRHIREE